jgi:hypothetical protein
MSRLLGPVPLLLLCLTAAAEGQPAPDGATGTAPDAVPSAAAEASPSTWPTRIDPLWIGDGANRLRVQLLSQARLTATFTDLGGEAPSDDARLTFQRIRPILRGRFLDGRLRVLAHFAIVPGEAELVDLFADLRIVPQLRLRAGQMKVPFTYHRQNSFVHLATTDWPLTSRHFGAERQIGVMAHGPLDGGVEYALGLFSGENARGAHARELPRIFGQSPGNPSSFVDARPYAAPHPELVLRIAHRHDAIDPARFFDTEGGGLRHALALSFAWDSGPIPERDYGMRLAPELLLQWEHLSLVVIGYGALFEDGGLEPGAAGVLAELGWHAHRHLELAVRYARVDFSDALRSAARAFEAQQNPMEPDPSVGTVEARQELSFAVHVLIIGRSLAWQSDVTWLRQTLDGGARDDLRIRSQLQLAF